MTAQQIFAVYEELAHEGYWRFQTTTIARDGAVRDFVPYSAIVWC